MQSTETYPSPGLVNKAISLASHAATSYLLACDNGLYRFDAATRPVLLKSGSFVDAAECPGKKGAPVKLVVVDSDGAAERLSMVSQQEGR